jgi:hypothetical protein
LPLFGIMAGIILVASGMALSQHKAWGRTAIEVAAWMGLVLGISAVGIYLWAEIPFDPTETVEMQEAGRFGVALAIAGLLAWTVTVAWIIRGLRRADLRDILRA